MSDPHVTTGRKKWRACKLCGATVEHLESRGVFLGGVAWSAVEHDATCGQPCLGGGIGTEARNRLRPAFDHWTEGVHGWRRRDDGPRACPRGCAIEDE